MIPNIGMDEAVTQQPVEEIAKNSLLEAALLIAREAPARRGSYTAAARINWRHVEVIRTALIELGIDWNHWDFKRELLRLQQLYGLSGAGHDSSMLTRIREEHSDHNTDEDDLPY